MCVFQTEKRNRCTVNETIRNLLICRSKKPKHLKSFSHFILKFGTFDFDFQDGRILALADELFECV